MSVDDAGRQSNDSITTEDHWLRRLSSYQVLENRTERNLEEIQMLYQQKRGLMKKYLCWEMNNLEANKYLNVDDAESIRCKELLVCYYECIRRYEDDISVTPAIIWFLVSFLGAVVTGILLNIADFDNADQDPAAQHRILFAIGLLFVYLSCKIVNIIWAMLDILGFND
jgi:hypothetical protein